MTPDGSPTVRDIPPDEAQRLAGEGAVRVIDVRTPGEYRSLGHIPGAMLLPVDLVPAAAATLPLDGPPILLVCEHGMRSARAARFLAGAGFDGVLNMTGGMSAWRGPRDFEPGSPYHEAGPASWLVENASLLPRGGDVLDVACGSGRHSLLLAAAGYTVRAVDADAGRVDRLAAIAARLGLPVRAEVLDLEQGSVALGREAFDLVLVIHYLHRPLFPAILEALRPGGLLFYETFTVDQSQRGHPRNPAFLLEHGELETLARGLEIVARRDGEFEGRCVAGIVGRKPA